MKELFKNILLPVDLNRKRSLDQIEKAFLIATRLGCHLHIIHIEKAGRLSWREYLSGTDQQERTKKNQQTLAELQSSYSHQQTNDMAVFAEYHQGKAEPVILEYCIKKNIDLIITEMSSLWPALTEKLTIKRLTRKTGCPVISVSNQTGIKQLRNIVIPVNENLPIRKLMFSSFLARKFHARIHLIAMPDNATSDPTAVTGNLYRAYQLLRTHSNVAVECHPITGDHIADSTLNYARRIQADLIVVDSNNQESMLPGLLNRLLTRSINNQSRIPVMSIAST